MITTQAKRSVGAAMRRTAVHNMHPESLVARRIKGAEHVTILRKGSSGIRGTLANIDHHAHNVEPLVLALAPHVLAMVPHIKWGQGHNVHTFTTADGRKFDMVPLKRDGEYEGLELRLRPSRGKRVLMAQLLNVDDVEEFVSTMKRLFKAPSITHIRPLGNDCNE